MKKVAVLSLVFAFIVLFVTVAPVMAVPAQKIPVTVLTYGGANVPSERRETKGGIIHVEAIRSGNVNLTIGEQAPIKGTYSEFVRTMNNTKTGEVVIQNHDVLTFPGGTFEGVKQTRITAGTPPTLQQHAVFQGTGIFEGQTLMLSQEAPPYPATYTGFLLIH